MKHAIILIAFIVSFNNQRACAQATLTGYVTLQNSGKKSAFPAQVKSFGASDTDVRSADGFFQLNFDRKKPGEDITLDVVKPGYEVVNTHSLNTRLSADVSARLRIYICPEGDWRRFADEYYGTNQRIIHNNYKRKLAATEQQYASVKVENNTYRDELSRLADERDAALALAQSFSEKMARINLDEATDQYNKAFKLFTNGELDAFFALMTEENISADLAEADLSIARGEELIRIGRDKLVNAREAKTKIIEEFMIKARAHIIQLEWSQAERSFEIAVTADSLNYENLFEFALFLAKQNNHRRAKTYFEHCLYTASSPNDSAAALNALGMVLRELNEYEASGIRFKQSLRIKYKIAEANPTSELLESLALTLTNLGSVYYYDGDYENAKEFFEESIRILQIDDEYNNGVNNIDVLASVYGNYSNLLTDIKEYEHAKSHYVDAVRLFKTLIEKSTSYQEQYFQGLALNLTNLGNLYTELRQFDSAQVCLKEAFDIRQKLAEKNPDAFTAEMAHSMSEMGSFLMHNSDLESSKKQFENSIRIYRDLAKQDSATWLPKLARAYNGYGSVLKESGEYAKAKVQFKEVIRIYQLFARTDAAFESNTAIPYYNIGLVSYFAHEYDSSQVYFHLALQICKKEAKSNLDPVFPMIGTACFKLSEIAFIQDNYNAAKLYFDESLQAYEKLAEDNPTFYLPLIIQNCTDFSDTLYARGLASVSVPYYEKIAQTCLKMNELNPGKRLPALALAYDRVGEVTFELESWEQSLQYNKKSLQIYRQLEEIDPDNWTAEIMNVLTKIGLINIKLHDDQSAQTYYEEAILWGSKFAEKEPDLWLPVLANTYHQLGDIEIGKQNETNAFENFEQALGIYKKLLDFDSVMWLPKVQHNLTHLYELASRKRDYRSALTFAEEIVLITRKFVSAKTEEWLPEHAKYLYASGAMYYANNNPEDSKTSFLEAIQSFKTLAAIDPESYLHDLAACYNGLSAAYSALKQPDSALACLEASKALLLNAHPDDPQNVEIILARAWFFQGCILLHEGYKDQAIEAFRSAQILALKYPDVPEAVYLLDGITKRADGALPIPAENSLKDDKIQKPKKQAP